MQDSANQSACNKVLSFTFGMKSKSQEKHKSLTIKKQFEEEISDQEIWDK